MEEAVTTLLITPTIANTIALVSIAIILSKVASIIQIFRGKGAKDYVEITNANNKLLVSLAASLDDHIARHQVAMATIQDVSDRLAKILPHLPSDGSLHDEIVRQLGEVNRSIHGVATLLNDNADSYEINRRLGYVLDILSRLDERTRKL